MKIPLREYMKTEYPLTKKATAHYWAVQGYYNNAGPLAGKISKEGGRWYVKISQDTTVNQILESIKMQLEDR